MYAKMRGPVSMIAAIMLGLVFIASGAGKLLGDIETPAQVMAFINDILPEFLLIPPVMFFIYSMLVPWLFPIAELILGICLLIGFVPALAALLSLPLIFAFTATNIWAIVAGGYETCASCFGHWEQIFGHLSPVQSLLIDIAMIVLALLIVLMQPGKFISIRYPLTWLIKLPGKLPAFSKARFAGMLAATSKPLRANPWAYLGYLLGIAGIGLLLCAILNVFLSAEPVTDITRRTIIINDNVSVTGITAYQATVSFSTADPEITDILVYDRYGKIAGILSENQSSKLHHIVMDNLNPASTYYFQLLFSDRRGGKNISQRYDFTTVETPPAISHVRIAGLTDTSATIIWETDRPTTAEITLSQTANMDEHKVVVETLTSAHSTTLEPLAADHDYRFVIKATDAYGHQLSTTYAGDFSLKTGGQINQRAPDLNLPAVTGNNVSLSASKGKAVMLVFWNMSCPVCINKLPLLQEIFNSVSSSRFALITVHGPGREAAIKSLVESKGVSFPVLLDLSGDTGYKFNIGGVPSVFILDSTGIIRMRDLHFNDLPEFEKLIKPFITG